MSIFHRAWQKRKSSFTSISVSFAFCRTLARTLAACGDLAGESRVGRQDGVDQTSPVVGMLDGAAKEPQPG